MTNTESHRERSQSLSNAVRDPAGSLTGEQRHLLADLLDELALSARAVARMDHSSPDYLSKHRAMVASCWIEVAARYDALLAATEVPS